MVISIKVGMECYFTYRNSVHEFFLRFDDTRNTFVLGAKAQDEFSYKSAGLEAWVTASASALARSIL